MTFFFSLFKIISYSLVILWGALAVFAYRQARKAIDRYRVVEQLEHDQMQKWAGVIRKDFNCWTESNILKGCFIRFPLKALLLMGIVTGYIMVIYLISNFQKFGRSIQKLFIKLYVKRAYKWIYEVDQIELAQDVTTPIVISNHVCWFDIIFLVCRYYPISFVSKADVAFIPIVGKAAKFLKSLFLERDKKNDREVILKQISDRVQDYYSQHSQIHPLVIFPEGTTSNGTAILKFKQGAFAAKSSITIFSLNYSCEGFNMGMDEVTMLEHFVISLSLQAKLKVNSCEMSCLQEESVDGYMQRCRQQLSVLSGFQMSQCGYRQKQELKKKRRKES